MISILVAVLLIAFLFVEIRFIVRFHGSALTKIWIGLGSGLAFIGMFVVLTTLYARVDLGFQSKLRLYALTRNTNPAQLSQALIALDVREQNGQLEILRLGQQDPYAMIVYPGRVRQAQFVGDTFRFTGEPDTKVGGLWWLYTDTSTYTLVQEVN